MAAHKTQRTLAVEQYKCPTCHAEPKSVCTNSAGRRSPFHKARVELVCGATFIGLPESVAFCGRRAGHKPRHRTADGRLEWSQDLDGIDFRDALGEAS